MDMSSVLNLAFDVPGVHSSAERMNNCLLARPKLCATAITGIDQIMAVFCDCVKFRAYKMLLST